VGTNRRLDSLRPGARLRCGCRSRPRISTSPPADRGDVKTWRLAGPSRVRATSAFPNGTRRRPAVLLTHVHAPLRPEATFLRGHSPAGGSAPDPLTQAPTTPQNAPWRGRFGDPGEGCPVATAGSEPDLDARSPRDQPFFFLGTPRAHGRDGVTGATASSLNRCARRGRPLSDMWTNSAEKLRAAPRNRPEPDT